MPRVILGFALVMTVLAYGPVQDAGFVFEDDVYLTPVAEPLAAGAVFAPRGLSFLSYRLDTLVFGPQAKGYHAVNVLLHGALGLLVGLLALRMTGSELAGALSASAMLLHPMNTQAVAYITGRPEILAALGVVGAMVIASGRGSLLWRAIGASICIVLGAWAKETALIGFPLVALYLWIVRQELSTRMVIGLAGAMTLAALPVLVMRVFTNPYVGESERGLFGYAAIQATALWRYLGLVVVPVGLSVDHDFDLVNARIARIALGGLVLACVWLWMQREKAPLVVFAALWIVVAVLPRFVIQIPEVLHEHQFYLSMVGVSLLIGCGGQACESSPVQASCWEPS